MKVASARVETPFWRHNTGLGSELTSSLKLLPPPPHPSLLGFPTNHISFVTPSRTTHRAKGYGTLAGARGAVLLVLYAPVLNLEPTLLPRLHRAALLVEIACHRGHRRRPGRGWGSHFFVVVAPHGILKYTPIPSKKRVQLSCPRQRLQKLKDTGARRVRRNMLVFPRTTRQSAPGSAWLRMAPHGNPGPFPTKLLFVRALQASRE